MSRTIAVYADWLGLGGPRRLGWLHARTARGKERVEFEYDTAALLDPALAGIQLDPRIGVSPGPQFAAEQQDTFGIFADSSPDRWGRMLMKRRLERDIRDGVLAENTRWYESDYLLGVHDLYRAGAMRYRLEDTGNFLDDRDGIAAPPFVELRELENASLALERDPENTASAGREWLRMLIAPGGSLGGARPKASVVDTQGQLWIAKFPSVRDHHDMGGWEMLVHALAEACQLNVAPAQAQRFASQHHCFMVQRFDRTASGQRLHFASAMTLTGHTDGDDASNGVSYLEMAEVIIKGGASPGADLRELWSRIVFNILVSNCDDHLRNHGFILQPGRGWCLSPAYDMNPVPDADGLKLNITEADNALDLELAREVAPYFRVPAKQASAIIEDFKDVVRQWRLLADTLHIPRREQEQMAGAFRLAWG